MATALSVSACGAGAPGAERTVTVTETVTAPASSAEIVPEVAEPAPEDFVADEAAFYAKAIKLDKSLADMPRELVAGMGWNLCMIESTADLTDPMYKNVLGPAKARGTLAAAHEYLCPDNM